jgi:hypothetical protein
MKRRATQEKMKPTSTGKYTKQKTRHSLVNPVSRKGLEPEKKNVDTTINTSIVFGQSTGTLQLLNGLVPGNSATTRIGRTVTMRSLEIRWLGSLAPTTTGSSPLRMLVIYDKQTNASAPMATDILVSDLIDSPMNLSNSKRFIIIANEEISCVGTAGPQSWFSNIYRKLNLPIEFNTATNGTVGDIVTGAIFALFYQEGTLLVASPSNLFYSRIRFIDN